MAKRTKFGKYQSFIVLYNINAFIALFSSPIRLKYFPVFDDVRPPAVDCQSESDVDGRFH